MGSRSNDQRAGPGRVADESQLAPTATSALLVVDSLPPRAEVLPARREPGRNASAAAAAIAGELVTTAPRRVEVAGEVQLGIEVAGADQRHRLHRSPSSAWATSSTSAAVERQDREHGARE